MTRDDTAQTSPGGEQSDGEDQRGRARALGRGALVAGAVLAGTAVAAAVAWRTGLGGQPYGGAVVPLVLALVAGGLALLQRGARAERVVAVSTSALLGLVAGVLLAERTPLAPAELERRVRALAGADVTIEELTGSGGPACRPCAQVDVVLRTPAGTVDQPLVVVLRALEREGLAEVLLTSVIRPEQSTASGRSDDADFSLTAVPDYVGSRLTQVVALRVRARG